LFERAIELLHDGAGSAAEAELMGYARVNQAAALCRLGKLALAEQELRSALRKPEQLTPRLRVRALVTLANIHADQGDSFLGEMEADRAYQLACETGLADMSAKAVHTLARVLADQGQFAHAIQRFREAAKLYADTGEQYEAIRVRVMIGSCYVNLSKTREGIRLLRESLNDARSGGHRRLEAYAWCNLGEAYYNQTDPQRARACFRESDALAMYNDEKQTDILFLNAFYEWKMAGEEQNPTREKIAFGRLKVLRSNLERKFPEVEVFDEFVERGRHHA
jgi:tetratricopeptide (TPR) repeat protein